MKIIILSGKARHGKDTSGEIIYKLLKEKNKKVMKIGYADYVKYVATNYFGWNGEKDTEGRSKLQYIGTDLVRNKNLDFWVNNVIELVKVLEGIFDYVIITDCRFANEIERWYECGFKDVLPIRIIRRGYVSELSLESQEHLSEVALDNYSFPVIVEVFNLEELNTKIERLVNGFEW